MDYADDPSETFNYMFFDKKGKLISIKSVDWKCNEKNSCKHWVRGGFQKKKPLYLGFWPKLI